MSVIQPMERPSKLINGNANYLERFSKKLQLQTNDSYIFALSDVVELVNEQLESQEAEIVTRRLLGQMVTDIAEQMELSWDCVADIINCAPEQLTIDETYQQKLYAVGTMARMLGKSKIWVKNRLNNPVYTQYERINSDEYPEYHQEAYDALMYEAEVIEDIPIADETDLSMSAMATRLGRDKQWTKSRIAELGINGTLKINPFNSTQCIYYKESDFDLLNNNLKNNIVS